LNIVQILRNVPAPEHGSKKNYRYAFDFWSIVRNLSYVAQTIASLTQARKTAGLEKTPLIMTILVVISAYID
jgi:hypothetical protein